MLKESTAHTLARKLLRVAANRDEESDRDLLVQFVAKRDEDAFAELVRRHGRMVLAVARRVTGCQQDAEDAFQAAFLVLARRAAQIKHPEQLANWLYGVAYRTALEARKARRMVLEHPVSVLPEASAPVPPDDSSELRQAIDEELARLPDKYRAAVVLCDLEGLPRATAARRLKIPEGTLSSRLAYARKILANRLTRRGIHSTAGAIAALFAGEATGGSPPRELVSITARVASRFSKGGPVPPGLVSPFVSHITEGVMKIMLANRIRLSITAGILACGLVALGAIGFAQQPGQRGKGNQEEPAGTQGKKSNAQTNPPGKESSKPLFVARGIEDEDVPYGSLPMQAVVRMENGKLIIRRRVEESKPVMHQEGRYTVARAEHASTISGTEISDPSDVAVFDMKGNRLAQKAWKDKLKMDVHVLLGFDGKLPNPREMALFKEDTLLLILPANPNPAPPIVPPPSMTGYTPVTSYVPQTTYVPRTTYVPTPPNAGQPVVPAVPAYPAYPPGVREGAATPNSNYYPTTPLNDNQVNPGTVPVYPPTPAIVEHYAPNTVPADQAPTPSVETPRQDTRSTVPPSEVIQPLPELPQTQQGQPSQPTPAIPQSNTLPPTAQAQPSTTPPVIPQSNTLPPTAQAQPSQPLPTATPQSNTLPPSTAPAVPSTTPKPTSPETPRTAPPPAPTTRPAPVNPGPGNSSTPPPTAPVESSPAPGQLLSRTHADSEVRSQGSEG